MTKSTVRRVRTLNKETAAVFTAIVIILLAVTTVFGWDGVLAKDTGQPAAEETPTQIVDEYTVKADVSVIDGSGRIVVVPAPSWCGWLREEPLASAEHELMSNVLRFNTTAESVTFCFYDEGPSKNVTSIGGDTGPWYDTYHESHEFEISDLYNDYSLDSIGKRTPQMFEMGNYSIFFHEIDVEHSVTEVSRRSDSE